MTKFCHRVFIGAPLELLVISTAPCYTKKLLCKKYAPSKKNKQPTSSSSLLVSQPRAHYCCTTATTDVWPVRAANNAAIRACTNLMSRMNGKKTHTHTLYCCTTTAVCMYTCRRECTTPKKLPLSCAMALPRVRHGLTMSQGRILE